MSNKKPGLLRDVARYYSEKLLEHGETAKGVDWNGAESQILRFEQLCKLFDHSADYSLNDYGCGYGALFEFLTESKSMSSYLGIDISEQMVRSAKQRHRNHSHADFSCVRRTQSSRNL